VSPQTPSRRALPAPAPLPSPARANPALSPRARRRTPASRHGTIWCVPPLPSYRARADVDPFLLLLFARPSQRENIWRFFRFTRTTSRQAAVWGVLVPVGVFALAQQQDVRPSLSISSSHPSSFLRSRADGLLLLSSLVPPTPSTRPSSPPAAQVADRRRQARRPDCAVGHARPEALGARGGGSGGAGRRGRRVEQW